MKRLLQFGLLLMLLGWQNTTIRAQPATAIETLNIDFWPDYDRAAVLVLLTGALPAPGPVTVPLPPDADLNAVARIDTDGSMISVEYEATEGGVTFNTSNLGFRIEFYIPYAAEGNQHSFSYTWLSEAPVQRLSMVVQQPAAATEMIIDPEPVSVNEGQNDGLTYYTLGAETAPAGQPASVQVTYTMAEEQLTVGSAVNSDPAPAPPAEIESEGSGLSLLTEGDFDWPLVLGIIGVLLIVVAGTWQLATRQASSKPRKPKPRRPHASASRPSSSKTRQRKANFCHNCGDPVTLGDKFCRNCGTRIKD